MVDERGIKEAFEKVKKDIFSLGNEFSSLKNEIIELKSILKTIENDIENIKLQQIKNNNYPTHQQLIPAHSNTSTDNPTHPMEIRGLKYPNLAISIGNRGVPTDKPTDQQTDNPTDFSIKKPLERSIYDASKILESIDAIKKEIRLKFKSITSQEMLVFSTIYQL